MLRHALSIDVEDWSNGAQLLLTGRVTPPTDAVVRNTERMLRLVEGAGFKATWFVLGEIAEHFPRLVRLIADSGHEVGVHGYHHHLVHQMTPDQFRNRARDAKALVEQTAGVGVLGYRAAAASITADTRWALDVLGELGFTYDSSIFPFRRPSRGQPVEPLAPHRITTAGGRSLFEVPLTVVEAMGFRLPCLGGGYLRHFPWAYSAAAIRLLEQTGRSGVVYLHPYELDVEPPRRSSASERGLAQRLRFEKLKYFQYRNRRHTEAKLLRLWAGRSFGPIADVFGLRSNGGV